MIPYGRQDITEADIDAVVSVLRSDFLTQGPKVPAFEKAVADYCGAQHAVAVNSATSALHIACLALGLAPGGLLWTSPNTFVASANCARYCGADVDFVDINPQTGNLDPEALAEKLAAASQAGRLPDIVIPVHFAGQPCNMQRIGELAEQYGFRIIEDASHAIGARYRDEPVGNCHYSDITVFSFHPVKIITTAEGGMATTNDPELAQRMTLLRSHGITRDPERMTHEPDGPWYYQQIDLGFNYRMTELQAALGISQMTRLDEYVRRRHEIADRYDQLLAGLPLRPLVRQSNSLSALHLYVIQLDLEVIQKTYISIFEEMRTSGIGVNLHYIPVYRQPYYQDLGFRQEDFPGAEYYYSRALSLPIHPVLSQEDQSFICNKLQFFTFE